MAHVIDGNLIHASEELSASPSISEILWNFSRYKDRARIILEQNPHFYLRCPADESAYTPMYSATHFKAHPEHLNTTTLSMFSSMGPAVCFLIPNANSGS